MCDEKDLYQPALPWLHTNNNLLGEMLKNEYDISKLTTDDTGIIYPRTRSYSLKFLFQSLDNISIITNTNIN